MKKTTAAILILFTTLILFNHSRQAHAAFITYTLHSNFEFNGPNCTTGWNDNVNNTSTWLSFCSGSTLQMIHNSNTDTRQSRLYWRSNPADFPNPGTNTLIEVRFRYNYDPSRYPGYGNDAFGFPFTSYNGDYICYSGPRGFFSVRGTCNLPSNNLDVLTSHHNPFNGMHVSAVLDTNPYTAFGYQTPPGSRITTWNIAQFRYNSRTQRWYITVYTDNTELPTNPTQPYQPSGGIAIPPTYVSSVFPTSRWPQAMRIGHFVRMSGNTGTDGPGKWMWTEIDYIRVWSWNDTTDLAIQKTDATDPVIPGSDLTYTLSIQNNGINDASNVIVTDNLPPNTTFVSAGGTNFNCQHNGLTQETKCSYIGTFKPGNSASANITIHVPTNYPRTFILNSASVSSTTQDANLANNTDSEVTGIIVPDPAVTKSATPSIQAGDQIQYTIQVSEPTTYGKNLVITDQLPPNTTYVSHSSSIPCNYNTATRTLTCTSTNSLNTIIQLTIQTPITYPDQTVTNTVTISSSTPDRNLTNNTATAVTTVTRAADLSITKTGSPNPVLAGENLTYTLTAKNNGPGDAQNITITDNLPAGLSFNNISAPAGWTCSGTSIITCTKPTMATGETAVFTISTTVSAAVTTNSVTNTVSITSTTQDPDLSNNTDTETTTVQRRADLSITLTANASTVKVGNTIQFTAVTSNNGPSRAANPKVILTLPINWANPVITGNGWSCSYTNPQITCTGTSLDVGTSQTIQFTADVSAPPGTVTTIATTSSDTPDPDSTNNSDSVTTNITNSQIAYGPTGYIYLHTKQGSTLNAAQPEHDYKPDEVAPVMLQTPVGFAFSFHTENAPYICTDPPACNTKNPGTVFINSFTINTIQHNGQTVASPNTTITLNKYSEPTPSSCQSAWSECAAYNIFTGKYKWFNPDEYLYINWIKTDTGIFTCPTSYQCVTLENALPGEYEITGFVTITIDYPSHPTAEDTYTLPAKAKLLVVTPTPQEP